MVKNVSTSMRSAGAGPRDRRPRAPRGRPAAAWSTKSTSTVAALASGRRLGGQEHAVALHAAQLRGLQVGDQHDAVPGQFLGSVIGHQAGDDLPPLRAQVHGLDVELVRLGVARDRRDLRHAQVHELVELRAASAGGTGAGGWRFGGRFGTRRAAPAAAARTAASALGLRARRSARGGLDLHVLQPREQQRQPAEGAEALEPARGPPSAGGPRRAAARSVGGAGQVRRHEHRKSRTRYTRSRISAGGGLGFSFTPFQGSPSWKRLLPIDDRAKTAGKRRAARCAPGWRRSPLGGAHRLPELPSVGVPGGKPVGKVAARRSGSG